MIAAARDDGDSSGISKQARADFLLKSEIEETSEAERFVCCEIVDFNTRVVPSLDILGHVISETQIVTSISPL